MIEHLNKQQITEIITDYIDTSIYNYAILIDGEWGCGKTHLMTKTIMPAIDKHEEAKREKDSTYIARKPVYVSLYGIASESEISKQIFLKTIPILGKSKKGQMVANVSTNVISGVFSHFSFQLKSKDIQKWMLTLSKEKHILVFDDLERCNMDANSILGYINNFVEHDGIKTIIVANQEEIGKASAFDNIELKYMLASSNDIKFSVKNKAAFCREKYDNGNSLSVAELKRRVDEIFSENELYNRVKEKLIGTTIYFRPNLDEVIDALVETIALSNTECEIISEAKADIVELMRFKRHDNIRTLQSALHYFHMTYIATSVCGFSESLYKEILLYCVLASIKCKAGNPIYKWEENSIYGDVPYNDEIFTFHIATGFKFIDELVYFSKFDTKYIIDTLTTYVEHKMKSAEISDDPFYLLFRWWECSEITVKEYIEATINRLKENSYAFALYPEIMMRFAAIVSWGLPESILSEASIVMTDNVKISKEKVSFDYHSATTSNEYVAKLFSKHFDPLVKVAETTSESASHSEINNVFLNEGWGDAFDEFAYTNKENILINRQFFSLINIEPLIERIKIGTSYDICKFRYGVERIYGFSNLYDYYIGDLPNLRAFKMALDSIDTREYDAIKKVNIKLLIDLIAKKIDIIAQVEIE